MPACENFHVFLPTGVYALWKASGKCATPPQHQQTLGAARGISAMRLRRFAMFSNQPSTDRIHFQAPTDAAVKAGTSLAGEAVEHAKRASSAGSLSTKGIPVGSGSVSTDADGYLLNPADWSEDFACALAEREGLRLTPRHWAVIRYLRGYFCTYRIPASCCDLETILHFRAHWPRVAGQPRWLPGLFPAGGLRQQGHRLAGLPRPEQSSGCRLDA